MNKITAAMVDARDRARLKAVRSIRAMEVALRAALEGAKLKGLPNLASGSVPYRGVTIRSQDLAAKLPGPWFGVDWGKETLCLNADGELIIARRGRKGALNERYVMDHELELRDAERIAEVIGGVIEAHCAKATTRTRTFERLERYSEKIDRILKEDE